MPSAETVAFFNLPMRGRLDAIRNGDQPSCAETKAYYAARRAADLARVAAPAVLPHELPIERVS